MARIVDRHGVTRLAIPRQTKPEVAPGLPEGIPGGVTGGNPDGAAGEAAGRSDAPGRLEISISADPDFAVLEAKWRDLETRSNLSFFQSWTWTGCLAEERFPAPVLVEIREQQRTVALALFNRRGRTLSLGETGDAATDCIFIEFNGVLAESGSEARLTAACLRAARAWSGPGSDPGSGAWPSLAAMFRRRLVLSGVDAATAAAARQIGPVRRIRSLPAPFADLRAGHENFLAGRSANTRQQLRRSLRGYAETGPITIERAEDLPQAYAFLDGLAALHGAAWAARGYPGAFANPFFGRFHRALIARGLGRGEIDLFRIAAAARTIGFLYNFRYRGASLAYQSGFDYAGAGRHEKPGLTCHLEAIRFAAGWGAARYEFLAGDGRYKRSLSDQAETLHWIEVANPCSPWFLARRLADFVTPRHDAVRGFAAALPRPPQ